MLDWLTNRVEATPDRTALVRAETGERLGFEGLDTMVDDLAGRLAALGVEPDDHLGMAMETRLAAVCTVFAAERLGAVLVPLDAELTVGELEHQLAATDVTVLVCSSETETRTADAFDGPICSVDDAEEDAVESLGNVSPVTVEPASWELPETRLLLFTSGTTGDPKVVRLTAGNLLWSAVASALRLGLHCEDRWLVCLPLHHMGGLSPVLRLPLYGSTVVLRESFDAGRTADDIGNHGITCVSLVPTMLKRMLDLRGTLADSLRVVLLGGAPAPDELIERCRDFSVPVHPTYGMTETASQVATATPDEAFDDIGTVGRPLFWTSVTVRDDGESAEPGEVGEFVVDGPTVSPGYYRNAEATRTAFGPHGLRTGDVGFRDADGRLFVVGRVDDRIITGGENVYPREVVDVLRSHPAVVDAAVVGLPHDEWGQRVGALVVGDDELTAAELDDHCRERLAGFKLPRVISFAETLPRTGSGTVRREAVRERLRDGTAIPDTEESGHAAVEGATDDATEPGVAAAGATGPEDRSDERDVRATDDADAGTDDDAFLVGRDDWAVQDAPGADVNRADVDAGVSGEPSPVDAGSDTDTDLEQNPPDFVQEALAAGGSDESTLETGDDAETGAGNETEGDDSDENDATVATDRSGEDDAETEGDDSDGDATAATDDPDEDEDPSAP